jgi:hypothetical protein
MRSTQQPVLVSLRMLSLAWNSVRPHTGPRWLICSQVGHWSHQISTVTLDAAVQRDVDLLSDLELGPQQPVDPSDSGPLGPIWPEVPPEWGGALAHLLEAQEYAHAPLYVVVEPGTASPELVREFLDSLDSLYRSCGGSGLKIAKGGTRGTSGGEAVR